MVRGQVESSSSSPTTSRPFQKIFAACLSTLPLKKNFSSSSFGTQTFQREASTSGALYFSSPPTQLVELTLSFPSLRSLPFLQRRLQMINQRRLPFSSTLRPSRAPVLDFHERCPSRWPQVFEGVPPRRRLDLPPSLATSTLSPPLTTSFLEVGTPFPVSPWRIVETSGRESPGRTRTSCSDHLSSRSCPGS